MRETRDASPDASPDSAPDHSERRLRPYRPGADDAAIARICLLTADSGGDATGLLGEDDDLWAEIYALPYLARHPDLAFVVADAADEPVGYVLGTDDTEAFDYWFRAQWWPAHSVRWPEAAAGDETHAVAASEPRDGLIRTAWNRGRSHEPLAEPYPAHLHIDLLPQAQGRGWGRRLIERLVAELRDRGVRGLHLRASEANDGAIAFYPRVGFTRLDSEPGSAAFGMDLASPGPDAPS